MTMFYRLLTLFLLGLSLITVARGLNMTKSSLLRRGVAPLMMSADTTKEDIVNILVVGASGRVGGSAMRAIRQRHPGVNIAVGGRDVNNWEQHKRDKTINSDLPKYFKDIKVREKSALDCALLG
jgi:hypothetical protein